MKVLDNMHVPAHMTITASLLAGYRFTDGSLIEVDSAGDYRITNAYGVVIAETVDSEPGQNKGLHRGGGGPPMAEDYGDIMDDLAAFLSHDGSRYESLKDMGDYDDGEDYIFTGLIEPDGVAQWAYEHEMELSELACYQEDKRLGEGQFANEEEG